MKIDSIQNQGIVEIKKLCAQYGVSLVELSLYLQVTWTRFYEIFSGRRRITADTDIRLCHFFKKNVGYFAKMQLEYDLQLEARNLQDKLNKIKNVDEIIKR